MAEPTKSPAELQSDQVSFWNGKMGDTWVETQAFTDAMLKPFEDLLLRSVREAKPSSILDVGCGNGTTTRSLQLLLGNSGRCTGIDLSSQMIRNAEELSAGLAGQPAFICGDAAAHNFSSSAYDAIVSRFGVMFFSDPVVAFHNLLRAATEEGQLIAIVWRSPSENAFMTAAKRATAPFLPDAPERNPTWPGPFSLADPNHAQSVLAAAGWSNIQQSPIDVECGFNLSDLGMFIERLAPIGHELSEFDPDVRPEVLAGVQAAYQPFIIDDRVQFVGSCWLLKASKTRT